MKRELKHTTTENHEFTKTGREETDKRTTKYSEYNKMVLVITNTYISKWKWIKLSNHKV